MLKMPYEFIYNNERYPFYFELSDEETNKAIEEYLSYDDVVKKAEELLDIKDKPVLIAYIQKAFDDEESIAYAWLKKRYQQTAEDEFNVWVKDNIIEKKADNVVDKAKDEQNINNMDDFDIDECTKYLYANGIDDFGIGNADEDDAADVVAYIIVYAARDLAKIEALLYAKHYNINTFIPDDEDERTITGEKYYARIDILQNKMTDAKVNDAASDVLLVKRHILAYIKQMRDAGNDSIHLSWLEELLNDIISETGLVKAKYDKQKTKFIIGNKKQIKELTAKDYVVLAGRPGQLIVEETNADGDIICSFLDNLTGQYDKIIASPTDLVVTLPNFKEAVKQYTEEEILSKLENL